MANDQRLMAKGQDIRAALNERQLFFLNQELRPKAFELFSSTNGSKANSFSFWFDFALGIGAASF